MTVWSRLVLIVLVLAGLLATPALAFRMGCDGQRIPAPAMTMAAPVALHDHAMPMKQHHHKPSSDACGLACLSHCLTMSAFVPGLTPLPLELAGAAMPSRPRLALPEGLAHGPPLEPPITPFV